MRGILRIIVLGILLLGVFLALDDITTSQQKSYFWEYMYLGFAGLVFGWWIFYRVKRRWYWIPILFLVIPLVIAVSGLKSRKISVPLSEKVTVIRVIDGDTIEIMNEEKVDTVRLIGIDAPEVEPLECFGEETYTYVRNMLEGKKVILTGDINFEDKDKYGRLLRYVYLEDGLNFNLSLLEDGYAREYYYMEIGYLNRKDFVQGEERAKIQNRGLWKKCEEVNNIKNLNE